MMEIETFSKSSKIARKHWLDSVLKSAKSLDGPIGKLSASRGIYAILNKENGKTYIGQSENIKARAFSHISALRKNAHVNKTLQEDYAAFGERAFVFLVVLICGGGDNLLEIEKHVISLQNDSYNGTPGHPSLSESEDTILISIRMTPSQREKFKALGGSKWLRAQIDKTGVP